MRVLYLVPQPKQPGRLSAYTFLDEEILGLVRTGVEAFVLSTRAQADTEAGPVQIRSLRRRGATLVETAGFLLRSAPIIPPANAARQRDLYRALTIERAAAAVVATEGIDVIHSHFGWPGSFGGALARAATRRPLVASLRGADLMISPEAGYGRRADPYHDRTIRRLLATADRTVYFSRFMRDNGVALGAPADRAHVVRKGVDLSRFVPPGEGQDRAALRRSLDLPDRPVVLTVAALIRLKGVHHVIEAAARLLDRHDFSLVICGEGDQRDALERLSAQLAVRDRTYFRGRVDRETVARYFAACDAFVLASSLEAAGNVVLEAMAAARPVVCTASGGPPEYVVEGATGFVVPVGDVATLAARLRQLLDDPSLAGRLGARGRRVAVEQFGFDRMTGDIQRLYHDLLAERAQPARRTALAEAGRGHHHRLGEVAPAVGPVGEPAPLQRDR